MEFSVSREAFVFLCSAAAGAVIFLIYDLFRIIRIKSGAGRLLVHIQDGVFWLAALTVMFFVVFYVNNGTLRFYEILGAGLGAILYGLTLSAPVLRGLSAIIDFFSKIFKVFLKILLTPLFFTYNIVYRCICLVFRPIRRLGRAVLRRLRETGRRTARLIRKK